MAELSEDAQGFLPVDVLGDQGTTTTIIIITTKNALKKPS